MDSFELIENPDAMNWNKLSDIIEKATKIRSIMEDQAIGVMLNAQTIMKENNTHYFPSSEQKVLYSFLGFKGTYKQADKGMASLAKHKKIKYAVAAFAEGVNGGMVTCEFQPILSSLYSPTERIAYGSQAYKEAKKLFWDGFDKRKKI